MITKFSIQSLHHQRMTLLQVLLSFRCVSELQHQQLYLLHEHRLLLGELRLLVTICSLEYLDLIGASALANLVVVES